MFLNGTMVRVPGGTTVTALLDLHDPPLALALRAGEARATDGRGIEVDRAEPLPAGAILRVYRSARSTAADA